MVANHKSFSDDGNQLHPTTNDHDADSTPEHDDATPSDPIDPYLVLRAAWLTRVPRLEQFAARFFAYRLENYLDDEEFATVIRESAARIEARQDTDSIELVDDIRYYLSERFRLRFEDVGWEEMEDEEEEKQRMVAERDGKKEGGEEGKERKERENQGKNGPAQHADGSTSPTPATSTNHTTSPSNPDTSNPINSSSLSPSTPPSVPQSLAKNADRDRDRDQAILVANANANAGGEIRTLDGDVAGDEFAAEAQNYQILLARIDALLERLRLDA